MDLIMKGLVLSLAVAFSLSACSQTDGVSLLKKQCTGCHNLIPVCSKLGQKNLQDWKSTVEAMKKVGAKVSASESDRIAELLSKQRQETAEFCR